MNDVNRSKDSAWLQEVFAQYEDRLIRYAARLLGDVDRARDVAQDAFLRLCREDRDRIESRVGPWLFTVCRNRAMDIRKKEQRMNWLSDAQTEQTASTEMGPADAAERRDAAGVAFTLLGRLPNNQQEVIRLKVENGMSYREISDVTGLSVSNVGYLIHQGVKTLREQFTRLQSTA